MGNETLCYFVVLFDRELFHDQTSMCGLSRKQKHMFFLQRTSFPRSMRCKPLSVRKSRSIWLRYFVQARSYSQGSM
jgi:hypothetical protein